MHPSDIALLRAIRHSADELLASGGDSRLLVDTASGLGKYGCATRPRPDTLAFGSCTASSVSALGYAAACRLHRRLLAIDDEDDLRDAVGERLSALRDELAFLLTRCRVPGVEVVLSPSGTDVELMALALAQGCDGAPVTNILIGPTEVGSGSPLAAAGRHFDSMTPNGRRRQEGDPVDERLAERTEVANVWVRDGDGAARAEHAVDAEVESLVDEHIARGRRILLHVVAHSKTGLHAPSLQAVNRLRARYGDEVLVVIDAAQGRFSRRGLTEVLNDGHMVVITGSKFFGGPPFCGALLVPPNLAPKARGLERLPAGFADYFTADQLPSSWRRLRVDLPRTGNLGLLLRWTAAIAEMREYYGTPSQLRLRVLRAFEHLAPEILSSSSHVELEVSSPPILADDFERVLQSKATVFSFSLLDTDGARLDADALRRVWRWLNVDVSALLPSGSESARRSLAPCLHTGQPVALTQNDTGPAVLRVAIGGVLVTQVAQDPDWGTRFEDRLLRLEDAIDSLRRKLETILRHYPTLISTQAQSVESQRLAS
jgi:hypothetical protein